MLGDSFNPPSLVCLMYDLSNGKHHSLMTLLIRNPDGLVFEFYELVRWFASNSPPIEPLWAVGIWLFLKDDSLYIYITLSSFDPCQCLVCGQHNQ